MRRLALLAALVLLTAVAATAQREQDFALRFMALHGAEHELTGKTISPKMMERIMRLEAVDNDRAARQLLAQLKGIRILTAENEDEAGAKLLYEKAEELARRNKKRYALHSRRGNTTIYVRRRGKTLVELVALRLKEKNRFSLLDFTGNMSEDFIDQMTQL